jgi:Zn-finger nucleic acid-binding protein
MDDALACPSCRAPMERRDFARRPLGELALDICFECRAIWFDQYESAQLAPGSVVTLFGMINETRDKPARPLGDAMDCPRCETRLALTQDVQRTNRISYHRCPQGHGRFTTFFQFLREKEFVRSLSVGEVEQLKATVKQVRCSSCGGAVDIGRDAACPYCRAPLSLLDSEAVCKALATLGDAQRLSAKPDTARVAAAFDEIVAARRAATKVDDWRSQVSTLASGPLLVDLVVDGISRLFD